MTEQPKVSILIPVYNTAKYLPDCLRSVLRQTLREIEIVAVNDASPDNAAEVLDEYSRLDPRVRVVTHEKNGGILAARLSGIAAARGKYIICLDADDHLDRDIARAALAKAERTGADIVHFEFDVRLGDGRRTPFARSVEKALRPYNGRLLGDRVFEGAFVDNLYRWNICGKFISTEICRKAAAALPPGYYIMAEDFCFYSLMAYFARHYEPLFKKGYYYGLDIGVSAYAMVDRKGFEKNCSVFTALNAVKHFLTARGAFEKYRKAFEGQELKIMCDLLDRWEHKVVPGERAWAFRYMAEHYDPAGLLRALESYFGSMSEKLALYMGRPDFLKRPVVPPKRVALVCEAPDSDYGRMLLHAAQCWLDQGGEVVLLSPHPAAEPLPEGLRPASLPSLLSDRMGFWQEKHAFDTVVYGDAAGENALFDMLAIKLAGLQLAVLSSEAVDSVGGGDLKHFCTRTRALELADAGAVRSSGEVVFLQGLGVRSSAVGRAWREAADPVETKHGKHLVCLVDWGTSSASVLLSAWGRVASRFHDCKLLIPGRLPNASVERELHILMHAFGVTDRVRLGGLAAWNEAAGGVLLASAEEVGVALEEAVCRRLPVVDGRLLSPEALAEELAGLLSHGVPEHVWKATPEDDKASWKNFWALFEMPVPAADAVVDMERKMLTSIALYQSTHEPYMLIPPTGGDCFLPFYRVLDSLVDRVLPPTSSRRRFVFRAGRWLSRRIRLK